MSDDLLLQVEQLQNLLVSKATNGVENNSDFVRLRNSILENESLSSMSPRFLKTCRNIDQFWNFIKGKYSGIGSHKERKEYLWGEFRPLLDFLEQDGTIPSDATVIATLQKVDSEHVRTEWDKALSRRSSDPDGAITIARTLIESVCKHILDEAKISYDDLSDLPKLYKKTAEALKLLPSQHDEQIFKQILGGCATVVEGLGALRNKRGDAHGKGKNNVKPAPRHAALAVNLSGALASYLVETWEHRKKQ